MEQIIANILYPLVVSSITALFFLFMKAHSSTVVNRERSKEDRRSFKRSIVLFDRLLSTLNDPDSTFNSKAIQSELRHQFPFIEERELDS